MFSFLRHPVDVWFYSMIAGDCSLCRECVGCRGVVLLVDVDDAVCSFVLG